VDEMTKAQRLLPVTRRSIVSVFTVYFLISGLAYAATNKNKGADYQAPRNSQGHPDL